MKPIFILISFIFFSQFADAQLECGARYTDKTKFYLEQHRDTMRYFERQYLQMQARGAMSQRTIQIPIKAHIIRRSDGTGGLTTNDLNTAIATLNTRFNGSGLQFFLCEGVNFIDSDTYYNFNMNDETAMTSVHNRDNMMNIYFAETIVTPNNLSLCGYAYYPGGAEVVLMDNSCTISGATLSHEVGHFFGLVHTHGESNNPGSTLELVDGSNCSTEGDFVCDTPADPQLGHGNVTTNCNYNGTAVDANSDAYAPDVTNLMSYSRQNCRSTFTQQQFARAYAAFQTTNRNNLNCPANISNFIADTTSSCQPGLTVNFSDNSLNAVSWAWDINNDGITDYTTQNVTHTYTFAGIYSVSLTASDGTASDTMTRVGYIEVGDGTTLASNTLTLELTLDNFPHETTWDFRDGNNNVLYSGGSYVQGRDNGTTIMQTMNLNSNSCYKFTIYDTHSDGICCAYGNGSYRLFTSDGSTVASGSTFSDIQEHRFGTGVLSTASVLQNEWSLYPNPASKQINIESTIMFERLEIYNALGQQMTSVKTPADSGHTIDVSMYKSGIYFIRLTSKSGELSTKSFIKR